jgi:hypothetical protein
MRGFVRVAPVAVGEAATGEGAVAGEGADVSAGGITGIARVG